MRSLSETIAEVAINVVLVIYVGAKVTPVPSQFRRREAFSDRGIIPGLPILNVPNGAQSRIETIYRYRNVPSVS